MADETNFLPAGENQPAEALTSGEKWFQRGVIAGLLLAGAVILSPNLAEPDLWGHVQYGRDALAEGLPETTTYSYSVDNFLWINHENLAELLLALGAETVGPMGLMIAKCLLGLAVLAAIVRHCTVRGTGLITVVAVVMLTAMNLSHFWYLRPQLLTYVNFAALLALLSFCFQGWEGSWRLPAWKKLGSAPDPPPLAYSSRRMRLLWLGPVLIFAWTNSHGGFVAGLAIFIAYLVCRGLEVLLLRGRASWGLLARFGMMIAAAVLATFINPYGPGLHGWLMRSLGSPRPEILEWWPPDLLSLTAWPIWLLLATWLLSLLFTRRSRDFTHMALMGIVLWQALSHQRHLPFFAMMFAFWMPWHVDSLLRRLWIVRQEANLESSAPAWFRPVLAGMFLLAFGFLGFRLYERLHVIRVEREEYPVSAVQYIADQELSGKMVVTYNWAQYVIAAFGTKEPGERGILVQFDGRFRTCYPQEVVDMHFDFVLGQEQVLRYRGPDSPPFDEGWVLDYRRPDLVLLSKLQGPSVRAMQRHKDNWVLLYEDELAQLWGRRDRYGDPASPHFIPPHQRQISDAPQEGFVAWPALPEYGGKNRRFAQQ